MAEIGTSEWWLERLGKELDARQPRLREYDNYYRGIHPLTFSSQKFRSAFGDLFGNFADNLMALVIEAVDERLDVEGFRIADKRGDTDAWRIWQENNLDAESQLAHIAALVKEQSYALVWGEGDEVRITIEDPLETIVAFQPGNRRIKRAGLKRWIDKDFKRVHATLYFPDRIEKYQSAQTVEPTTALSLQQVRWERREVDNEAWPLTNPLSEVPLVPLTNKPRLDGCGESEIATVIRIQDAINKLCMDMLVAAEFGAFRQRWAVGIEIPTDPETNEPIEPFKVSADRLWAVEDENAKFGEFGQTDLSPYVKAIEMYVQHIASITRTPAHYLLGFMGQFPSGESLKATETGLVSKARRKMRHFGESWESTMRLAFRVLDDPRGKVTDSETVWRDPESRTESEHVDAVMKQQALGIPQEQLWEELGYSPPQIERFRKMRAQEALEVSTSFDPFARANAGESQEP